MISVRLRIFFLALFALCAVTGAFFIEYKDIQKKLQSTENTLQTLSDIKSLSKLVHSLQRERGLSAGQMIGNDATLDDLFSRQREITNIRLSELISTSAIQDQKFTEDFPNALKIVRQRMDSGDLEWVELREFYTSSVRNLLELMLINVLSMNYAQDISFELQSLSYIAITRENLGLIRATLNRAYQQGSLPAEELSYLNQQYGAFTSNHTMFEAISNAHSNKKTYSEWLSEHKNEVFESVIAQIETTLNTAGGAIAKGSPSIWWREATIVIDAMKRQEDKIFNQIEQDSLELMDYYNRYLYWYAILAFSILAAVMLLTAFSVHRILKALSILLQSLHTVEQTQNYGLRILTGSKDEFGQLSYSINSLLSYTDKLIKDKDLLASTDLLTDVMNRRSFTIAAEKELQRNDRYGGPFSIIFCDIDFFKSVNDKYGHAIGDDVLKKFAKTIKANIRASDYVGRWGGEEFIVLAPDTDLAAAGKLSEKLREKIMALSVDPVKQVTSSFGVAQRTAGESFIKLCDRADKALYQAKETGRNKVCLSK